MADVLFLPARRPSGNPGGTGRTLNFLINTVLAPDGLMVAAFWNTVPSDSFPRPLLLSETVSKSLGLACPGGGARRALSLAGSSGSSLSVLEWPATPSGPGDQAGISLESGVPPIGTHGCLPPHYATSTSLAAEELVAPAQQHSPWGPGPSPRLM